MNNLPNFEAEAAALGNFLVESASAAYLKVPQTAEVRAAAESMLKRISTPVRVMIAGEFSSGKSTLTNLLVGQQLIPTGVLASPLPPVVFRHGNSLSASACWWDGHEPKVFPTANFEKMMALDPDYIVLTAPNPFLQHVTIFDTPGTSDPDREGEVLIELSGRAEMVIWCTNAVQAWRESERHTWFQLSPNVIKNGLLAVTHVDLPSVKQGYGRIMARLAKEAGPNFHSILPIETLTAIEAAPGGVVKDKAQWAKSGGAGLIDGILKLAGDIRLPDIIAAREMIAKRIKPLIAAVEHDMESATVTPITAANNDPPPKPASMPKPEPSAPPAAAAPRGKINPLAGFAKLKERPQREADDVLADEPAADFEDAGPPAVAEVAKTPTAPLHPLMASWQGKMNALIAQVKGSNDPESSGFGQAASDTMMEIVDAVASADLTRPDTEWMFAQFQEALDMMILMQTESGESALEDAAILLLQVSRDLQRLTMQKTG